MGTTRESRLTKIITLRDINYILWMAVSLDNRPFSYTIKEMYYRTGYRPVDRKLFYIDPCPDRFTDNENFKKIPKPNTLQVIGDSLVGIPMYESIGKDLEAIKEHNEKSAATSLFLQMQKRSLIPARDYRHYRY
jgi:hypothetical protein